MFLVFSPLTPLKLGGVATARPRRLRRQVLVKQCIPIQHSKPKDEIFLLHLTFLDINNGLYGVAPKP